LPPEKRVGAQSNQRSAQRQNDPYVWPRADWSIQIMRRTVNSSCDQFGIGVPVIAMNRSVRRASSCVAQVHDVLRPFA
jgi:hypothetical protein